MKVGTIIEPDLTPPMPEKHMDGTPVQYPIKCFDVVAHKLQENAYEAKRFTAIKKLIAFNRLPRYKSTI